MRTKITPDRYNNPQYWDIVWGRPYVNYEKHHQLFWDRIRKDSKGKILDVACGSGSCWKGLKNKDLYLVDFSPQAIREAHRNYPTGHFHVDTIPTHHYDDMTFDTVVLCGLINYYRSLTNIKKMIKRITKKGSKVIITINVIDDFPGRHWDAGTIRDEFEDISENMTIDFVEKVGYYISIIV